jgi:hypothetical protein
MADDDTRNEIDTNHATPDDPLLARVPEWVVPLGAGSLAASTLITTAIAIFIAYSIATGQRYGFESYELYLAEVQFILVTLFQAVGVYFARQRIRWIWVMLAAILGSLAFVTIPFTAVAVVCLGIGKYHFASHTPTTFIKGT